MRGLTSLFVLALVWLASAAVVSARHDLYSLNNNGSVMKIAPSGAVSQAAGLGGSGWSGITSDVSGNLYTINYYGPIVEITPSGTVSQVANLSADGYNGMGWSAITSDVLGDLYAINIYGLAVKITPAGTSRIDLPYAGGYDYYYGIATDATGNVYPLSYYNGLVAKITPTGTLSQIAYLSNSYGWGWSGITSDFAGNLYALNTNNNNVMEVTPSGAVSQIANLAEYGLYYGWYGITSDFAGNLYPLNNYGPVMEVTSQGIVSQIADLGGSGWSGIATQLFGDMDNDGVIVGDNCRAIWNPSQADADGDHIGNVCDGLPTIANPDQNEVVFLTAGTRTGNARFALSNDILNGTIINPLAVKTVEYELTGASTPYIGIAVDGNQVLPYYIVNQSDGTYTVKFATALDAALLSGVTDPDAAALTTDESSNIIIPVSGVSYAADGSVNYQYGNHTLGATPLFIGAPPKPQFSLAFGAAGQASFALGDRVAVDANVSANGSAFNGAYVFATLESPSGATYSARLSLAGPGEYSGMIDVPKTEQSGSWHLVSVAIDPQGGFLTAFGSQPIALGLTHFSTVVTKGVKINDLSLRLDSATDEAAFSVTNTGTAAMTERMSAQWNDMYTFYTEVKDSHGAVIASETYNPLLFPGPGFLGFDLVLRPGETKSLTAKAYRLLAAVVNGSQPDPANPYAFTAVPSGTFTATFRITNQAPVDAANQIFSVGGLDGSDRAVVYVNGVPTYFPAVANGSVRFTYTISAGGSMNFTIKALTAAEAASANITETLPSEFKMSLKVRNNGNVPIQDPSLFVVWTPADAARFVTQEEMGGRFSDKRGWEYGKKGHKVPCITSVDKNGVCRPLKPGETASVELNFKALTNATITVTAWIDGTNFVPKRSDQTFTIAPVGTKVVLQSVDMQAPILLSLIDSLPVNVVDALTVFVVAVLLIVGAVLGKNYFCGGRKNP